MVDPRPIPWLSIVAADSTPRRQIPRFVAHLGLTGFKIKHWLAKGGPHGKPVNPFSTNSEVRQEQKLPERRRLIGVDITGAANPAPADALAFDTAFPEIPVELGRIPVSANAAKNIELLSAGRGKATLPPLAGPPKASESTPTLKTRPNSWPRPKTWLLLLKWSYDAKAAAQGRSV